MTNTTVRLLAVAAVAVVASASHAPQALAHASLVATSPKEDGTVTSPQKAVTLKFNEDIQSSYSKVAVTGPDGTKISTGEPSVSDENVTQRIEPFSEAGKYEVGYRVVSADGHPVSGSFSFTVRPAAVTEPTPTHSGTPTDGATAEASESAVTTAKERATPATDEPTADQSFVERHATHLLIAAVVVALGVAVVLWERRRRSD